MAANIDAQMQHAGTYLTKVKSELSHLATAQDPALLSAAVDEGAGEIVSDSGDDDDFYDVRTPSPTLTEKSVTDDAVAVLDGLRYSDRDVAKLAK